MAEEVSMEIGKDRDWAKEAISLLKSRGELLEPRFAVYRFVR